LMGISEKSFALPCEQKFFPTAFRECHRIAACAAASLANGTRYGEQLT
jgi:hypothetical protein